VENKEMSKIIKAKLVEGRPIIMDFVVEGQIITYETMCPKCENKMFVISIDKSRIACTNTECRTVVYVRLHETETDMSEVTWKIN